MKKERLYRPLIAVVTVTVLLALLVPIAFFGLVRHTFPGFSIFEKEEKQTAEETKPEIPYVSLDATSPAVAVIEGVTNYIPPTLAGYPNTGTGSGTPEAPFSWVCPLDTGNTAPSVANMRNFAAGKENWVTMVVHAYPAGQGTAVEQRIEESVRACADRDGDGRRTSISAPVPATEGFEGSFYAGGQRYYAAVWNQSDVLMSVTGTDLGQVRQAALEYNDYLMSVLAPVCVSLELPVSDSTRSPYVDANAYTGWQRGREVTLNPDAPGLAPGYLPKDQPVSGRSVPRGNVPPSMAVAPDAAVPGAPLDVAVVTLPKQPLEPFTPASLPAAVEHPGAAPQAPPVPATSTTVPERVRDEDGPGCGWDFTGQKAPVYDDTAEKQRADGLAAEAHAKLVAERIAYQNARSVYLVAYADYAYRVQKYNEYAGQVAAVAAAWDDLNQKRAVYRAALDAYYRDLDNYENFFDRKAQAQVDYEAALQRCVDQDKRREQYEKDLETWEKAMEEWEARQRERTPATPGPTPMPTPTANDPAPVKPVFEETETCPPTRPAILDQREPVQPTPPAKPDVPLPSSWTDVPN